MSNLAKVVAAIPLTLGFTSAIFALLALVSLVLAIELQLGLLVYVFFGISFASLVVPSVVFGATGFAILDYRNF